MDQAYNGKCVFITGATGFIGALLVKTISEKLKGVERIYCLYHSRTPGEASAYDKRVVWVKGDVTQANWGIAEGLLQSLREQVNIIFHLAAYTRWDTGLQDQVRANTLAALHGAELANTFEQLELFLVTSSYWAQCNRVGDGAIKEQVYQDHTAQAELDHIMETGSHPRLNEWPNAYAYAKNLMERLLHQQYPKLPIMVARITSVTGAWAYPYKGYCDFSISLPAFIRAVVVGGVKYFPLSMKAAVNDMIPVDICVNMLLANAVEPTNSTFEVINCSSATRNIPTLGEVTEMVGRVAYYANRDVFEQGLKSLDERQAKLNKVIVNAYGFAMSTCFTFDDTQARRPLAWMNPEAQARFPIDMDAVNWRSIITTMKNTLLATAAVGAPAVG
ncbi:MULTISPECIES: SDR family oxidoreductase [Pseudomonas]|uniref:NAD-dependent epimerase/dehydratase family protein n=1 Tax=Pseudomonas quercus TaxID=2722792 RepID=A0ABX0YCK8_9PSED|nr:MULTISPECIES: SDR family oxidoreductase [Pseudomonas]MBF7142218.1 SDR family oxidoreductase [Pseudomonas sp. LY10J]NJP00756.1 NAD-dependent epimerase/dehydratase family protein [Pseudomonas quercus]